MSANSDSRQLINRALQKGLVVTKAKHGGWTITTGDGVFVTRVPNGGKPPPHTVQKARRAIEAATQTKGA